MSSGRYRALFEVHLGRWRDRTATRARHLESNTVISKGANAMTRTPKLRAPARGKSRHALSPEERAERLSVARQQLLDGVDRLMTSEGWQQLITSRKWLRRYSLNNVLMILQQCPEATDVRPLSEWRESG